MDCCGSSKPKDTEKDVKPYPKDMEKGINADRLGNENDPAVKGQAHGGGCCGGGGLGMWLHLIIMLIGFAAIWYFGGR